MDALQPVFSWESLEGGWFKEAEKKKKFHSCWWGPFYPGLRMLHPQLDPHRHERQIFGAGVYKVKITGILVMTGERRKITKNSGLPQSSIIYLDETGHIYGH
jgi:hypothetical protein